VSFAAALQTATADSFCVYGFPFVLRTNHPDSQEAFLRLYRKFLSPRAGETGVEAVLSEETDGFRWRLREKALGASDLGSALWGLEAALCEAILRSQQRWTAIHAATVYSRDSAIMLVGPSGAGKSTLSVALSRRGFTLATDDVAFVDPQTLYVHPIPRCVHLDQESVRLLQADGLRFPDDWKRFSFLAPVDLDNRPIPECRAGLLIYIARPRAQRPQIRPVSQSEMAARLLSETGQGPLTDSENLAVLARISSSAGCFHLVPGSLSETADLVSDLSSQRQRTSVTTDRRGVRGAKDEDRCRPR
jgi:hypothetical protein